MMVGGRDDPEIMLKIGICIGGSVQCLSYEHSMYSLAALTKCRRTAKAPSFDLSLFTSNFCSKNARILSE